MHSTNFQLTNSSYGNQVIQKSGASGISLFIYDNSGNASNSISFLYNMNTPETALRAYADGLYQHDPLIPHNTSIFRNCKTFTGINFYRKKADSSLHNIPELNDAGYWRYFAEIGYQEVAASFKAISNNIFLVIGLHLNEKKKHLSLETASPAMDAWLKEAGEFVIDSAMKSFCANTITAERSPPVAEDIADRLTNRQYQVVCELLKGKTNKEIASTLSLSDYTVENHLRQVYKKFGVHNRTTLIAQINEASG